MDRMFDRLVRPPQKGQQALLLVGAVFCLSTTFGVLSTYDNTGGGTIRREDFKGGGDGDGGAHQNRYLDRKKVLGLPLCPQSRDTGKKEEEGKEKEEEDGEFRNGKFLAPRVKVHHRDDDDEEEEGSSPPRVFVSLSVCWSSNTRLHHKGAFPYRLATRLSVKLWRAKTPSFTPLVQVVHSSSSSSPELRSFVDGLESDGAVVRLVHTEGMDCALKSQLVRMLAFRDPAISAEDFIVIGDVDAFIVRGDIFSNLPVNGSDPDNNKNKHQVWLYQYEDAFRHESPFSMSFVAMRARTWQQVMRAAGGPADSAESLVSASACQLNLHFRSQWDYDQLILSRAVLKSGLCSVPKSNRLWEQVRVDPDTLEDISEEEARNRAFSKELRALVEGEQGAEKKTVAKPSGKLLSKLLRTHVNKLLFNSDDGDDDDEEEVTIKDDPSSSCFYGFGWANCNRGKPTVEGGCKWWHFYPTDRERDLMRKYYEIQD